MVFRMAEAVGPFGEYLESLMEAKGLSVRDLAAKAGVSPQAIHSWIRGSSLPSNDSIGLIALHLGADAQEMIGVSLRSPKPQHIIFVPVVKSLASAGPGSLANVEYWPYLPPPWARGHEFIAIEVTGTCMEPEIHEGEWALVDKNIVPEHGDFVVAIHEGETVLKQLELRGRKHYLVALQNEPPLEVNGQTHIVGKVITIQRDPYSRR